MPQLIIVAFGIQFRDIDWPNTDAFLNANCDPKKGVANAFTFPKGAGTTPTYEIQVIFDKSDFAKALDTAEAIVVYDGHSRWGRGPCFGPAGIAEMPDAKAFPINPWNLSFLMGYDATDTECMEDIMHHSTLPTEYNLTAALPAAFLSRGLAAAAKKAQESSEQIKAKKIKASAICSTLGAWREFDSCFNELAQTSTTRGDQPLKGRHFYQYRPRGSSPEFAASIIVGSADLDNSKLPGKLLVMGSCSSHAHFFGALDRRRKAVKSGCKFIMTSDVCSADLATEFLGLVLLKKLDPTTPKGMANIAKLLNGVSGSGGVGFY